MKKTFCILIILVTLGLTACSAPATQPTDSARTVPAATEPLTLAAPTLQPTAEAVVIFTDTALETKVREEMGKPKGEITIAEAKAVLKLDLSNESFDDMNKKNGGIRDISSLKSFTNLEELNLSFNDINDFYPLAELKSLKSLGFTGVRPKDLSALRSLTNLVNLVFDWSYAPNQGHNGYETLDFMSDMKNLEVFEAKGAGIKDITALGGLTKLWSVFLTDNLIEDISPLASLVNLKELELRNNPIKDFSPVKDIYPKLQAKDFEMVSSLSELGFELVDHDTTAGYKNENLTVTVNHSNWGTPTMESEANSVRMNLQMDNGSLLIVGYHPEIKAYVFAVIKNDKRLVDYIYNLPDGSFSGDRKVAEQAVRDALGEIAEKDILLAPIPVFNETLQKTFKLSADQLYALPLKAEVQTKTTDKASLVGLGFKADKSTAAYRYEQKDPHYYSVEIHNPEWGKWEEDGDVRFFTPLSDEYRIVVIYHLDEKKFSVGADDNTKGGAKFEFYSETFKVVESWCSDNKLTVKDYFTKAYNDPKITDVYTHSVEMMQQYITETFGMTIEELYALPKGE